MLKNNAENNTDWFEEDDVLVVHRGFRDVREILKHYENTPIQIYGKFYHQKNENFQIKILIFFTFLLKT